MRCSRLALLFALISWPQRATAQQPASPLAAADALIARGDSLGAIRLLQSAVAKDSRNAALWHRIGMLSWSYTRHAKQDIMTHDMARLRIVADSSLRLAAQFAKDNAQYWYDLAKFSLGTGNTFVRAGSKGFIERAVELAEQTADSVLLSRVRDEQGMHAWRLYETIANRVLTGSIIADSAPRISAAAGTDARAVLPPGVRRDRWAPFLGELYQPLDPPPGRVEYQNAVDAFVAAIRADPSNFSPVRHQFMAHAEQKRWNDLKRAATDGISRFSDMPDVWLARALASTRLNDMGDAAVSFDSAFARMSQNEQGHYRSFHRLLAPRIYQNKGLIPDSIQYQQATPELRAQWERLFWYLNEPRGSTPYNEVQLEFFARIVEADLLWTSDDLEMRGSDSDRGNTLLRYGPPDRVYNVPSPGGTIPQMLFWAYRNGVAFAFEMAPTYGVAYVPREDRVARDSILEEKPLSWANVKAVTRNVPMLARTTRFRGGGDSMDVVIAAAIPTLLLLQDSQLGGPLPIDVHIDVQDARARQLGGQKQQTTVRGDQLPTHINAWWQRRLGAGVNVVRIDAEQRDVDRAAVATAEVHVADSSGLILSDILFTEPVAQTTQTPKRWTDLTIKPTIGVFAATSPIGIVWENYGLTAENGNARYRVTLELERTFKNNLRGLGARVVANLKNVLQGNTTATGALLLSYDELRPYNAIVVDHMAINLRESVAGTYRLQITIRDLASGKTTSRRTDFTLVQ